MPLENLGLRFYPPLFQSNVSKNWYRNHRLGKRDELNDRFSPFSIMTRELDVVIEQDEEGWFIASVPQLRGCHTQARSLDELMIRIEEAARLCLNVIGELDSDVHFVGLQRLAIEV